MILEQKGQILRRLITTFIIYITTSEVLFHTVDFIKYITKKKDGISKVTPKYLKKWLGRQEAYTSHHPVDRVFKRPRAPAFSLNYQ